MSLFAPIKQALKRLLAVRGYELYRRPYLPKGADAFESLRAHWSQWRPHVIFDVGANVGQTAGRLRPLFPDAVIHAFEPIPDTFSTLKANMRSNPGVHCHQLALADCAGESFVQLHGSSEQNSLVPALRGTHATSGPEVKVTLETIDRFCARHSIAHVDLLKIDVEGFELAVLQGASSLLSAHRVDFIIAEAGLIPENPRFTPLPSLIERLRPHGFWLIGVYEQYGNRYNQTAEFCNALFALEKHLTPSTSHL